MKYSLRIILILAIISGCTKEKSDINVETISINPLSAKKTVNLSEFVDTIKYITLQSDSNCILGRTAKIKLGKRYIYACDVSQMTVVVYDIHGKYISKLDKRGRGPGEYVDFTSIFVDEQERYIEVGAGKKMLKYSIPNFELISERPIPFISANSMRKVKTTYYYSTQQMVNKINGKLTNAEIIVDVNGKLKALFRKKIKNDNASFLPYTESFTINDNKELFVTVTHDNTFYKLDDTNAIPALRIDFGKYQIDRTIAQKPIKKQIELINRSSNVAFFPVLSLNNTDFRIINYSYKEKHIQPVHYIEFRKNKKIIHARSIKNDLTGIPRFIDFSSCSGEANHEVWYEDYLVSIVQPEEILYEADEIISENIGRITYDSNPIIILMKPKKI